MSNNEYAPASADALLDRSRELAKLRGLAQSATVTSGGSCSPARPRWTIHLHKVYRKLGVSSRRALGEVSPP